MAARITNADIQAQCPTDLDTAWAITIAHLWVDEDLLPLATLSEARLTAIELMLGCHMVAINDPREIEKTLGPTKAVFERGLLKEGLASTRYGQMAIALDTTGTLASASTPQRTLFEVF